MNIEIVVSRKKGINFPEGILRNMGVHSTIGTSNYQRIKNSIHLTFDFGDAQKVYSALPRAGYYILDSKIKQTDKLKPVGEQ